MFTHMQSNNMPCGQLLYFIFTEETHNLETRLGFENEKSVIDKDLCHVEEI